MSRVTSEDDMEAKEKPQQMLGFEPDCGPLRAADQERRGWDLNPRYLAVHRFSRPAHSATLSPLRLRARMIEVILPPRQASASGDAVSGVHCHSNCPEPHSETVSIEGPRMFVVRGYLFWLADVVLVSGGILMKQVS